MDGSWASLSEWSPAQTLMVLGFILVCALEWAGIFSERGAKRRAQALRSDLFASYRRSLVASLDAFARWSGDNFDDNRPRSFSMASFLGCLGWATLYPVLFLAIGWAFLGTPGAIGDLLLFEEGAVFWQRSLTIIGLLIALVGPIIVLSWFRANATVPGPLWTSAVPICSATAAALALIAAGAVAIPFAVAAALSLAVSATLAFTRGAGFAGAIAAAIALFGATSAALAGSGSMVLAISTGLIVALICAVAPLLLARPIDSRALKWPIIATSSAVLLLPLSAAAMDHQFSALALNEVLLQPNSDLPIEPQRTAGPLVLFLVLLPALNAPLDLNRTGNLGGLRV